MKICAIGDLYFRAVPNLGGGGGVGKQSTFPAATAESDIAVNFAEREVP